MRGGSRLFTYAVEDEFEGVERGRGGGSWSGGCKGSVPLALFVFVGPHSVIRLLNAPRPSSFPPPQPRSTATGGDGDRCGEIQRAVNHRVLAYSRIPFCRSCSSLFADRRARRSPLSASLGSRPLPTPFSTSRFARPVFPPFFSLLFRGAASMRLCRAAKKERKNEETALYRSRAL